MNIEEELKTILTDFSDEMDYVTENPEDSHGKAEFFDRPYTEAIASIKALITKEIKQARRKELETLPRPDGTTTTSGYGLKVDHAITTRLLELNKDKE